MTQIIPIISTLSKYFDQFEENRSNEKTFLEIISQIDHSNYLAVLKFILDRLDPSLKSRVLIFCLRIIKHLVNIYQVELDCSVQWIFQIELLDQNLIAALLDLCQSLIVQKCKFSDAISKFSWLVYTSNFISFSYESLDILKQTENAYQYLSILFQDFSNSQNIQRGLLLLLKVFNSIKSSLLDKILNETFKNIDKLDKS